MPEIPPLERLAQRICKATNALGTKDASVIIVLFKQRSRISFVDGAVELAVAKEWLHFDGVTYTVSQGGAELGFQARRGPRTRRVMPF